MLVNRGTGSMELGLGLMLHTGNQEPFIPVFCRIGYSFIHVLTPTGPRIITVKIILSYILNYGRFVNALHFVALLFASLILSLGCLEKHEDYIGRVQFRAFDYNLFTISQTFPYIRTFNIAWNMRLVILTFAWKMPSCDCFAKWKNMFHS